MKKLFLMFTCCYLWNVLNCALEFSLLILISAAAANFLAPSEDSRSLSRERKVLRILSSRVGTSEKRKYPARIFHRFAYFLSFRAEIFPLEFFSHDLHIPLFTQVIHHGSTNRHQTHIRLQFPLISCSYSSRRTHRNGACHARRWELSTAASREKCFTIFTSSSLPHTPTSRQASTQNFPTFLTSLTDFALSYVLSKWN